MSETVQTGQEKKARAAFFEIKDDAGKWHWVLWSSNGRLLARNAVTFDKKKECIASIKALVAGIGTASLIVSSEEK